WNWVTAAVMLPVLTLAVTEVAGFTHFLRWPQPTPDPNPPAGTPRQWSQQTSKRESTPQAAAPFTDADVMRITALPPAAQAEDVDGIAVPQAPVTGIRLARDRREPGSGPSEGAMSVASHSQHTICWTRPTFPSVRRTLIPRGWKAELVSMSLT